MAVQLVDNFDLSSKKPLDSRAYWETLAALQANRTILMPDGFLAYVKDKKCYYIMNCTNPADPSTYTWSEFKTGSSSSGSGSTGGSGTTGPTYTAGDNIQISSDNKISATDTKYTLTADKDNPMKVVLTNTAKADDKQSVEIPIHTTAVEGYPTPVGTIIAFMGKTAPQNYLACDGAIYKIADYKELADFIKAQFGKYDFFGGNGTTTFAVPPLNGEFLRGTGTNSHTNQGSGADVGVHQDGTEIPNFYYDKNGDNFALLSTGKSSDKTTTIVNKEDSTIVGDGTLPYVHRTDVGSASSSSAYYTSRPTNTSVLYCIKYRSDTVLNNVFSTDETVIGRWIDGKPIYRKVSPVHTFTDSNFSIPGPENAENVTKLYGWVCNVSGTTVEGHYDQPIPFYFDSGNRGELYYVSGEIKVQSSGWNGRWFRYVIEYTKTTDDANTIPAGSHPSTYTEYSTVATDEEVEAALA